MKPWQREKKCVRFIGGRSQIKPNQNTTFEVDDFRFEFVLKDTLIDLIIVSFPVRQDQVPQITESKTIGVKADIKIVHPRWEELVTIIRQIEGMWSLWGCESIDISGYKIKWLPESEEEKQLIQLNDFQVGKHEYKPEEIDFIGFDLLARPVITAVKDKNHDVVLSFFRRGTNDIKRDEYIEAFYDFYFMLESPYGNGKTKNTAIERELISSELLEGYINKIVKLRGFLHHHNTKRKNGWDPGKQIAYKLEAFMLQSICINVGMEILDKSVFSERIINEYKNLFS